MISASLIDTLFTALISGAATGLVTVLTLKTDVKWLKEIIASHDERLKHLERKKENGLACK